jgi:hypothetical protein
MGNCETGAGCTYIWGYGRVVTEIAVDGSCVCDDLHWNCIATNGTGRTDVFFWRGNPLYFVLRLLISSLSPLRRSEIQTLLGYRRCSPCSTHPITVQFSVSSTCISTCLPNLATDSPYCSSSYYQPDLALYAPAT